MCSELHEAEEPQQGHAALLGSARARLLRLLLASTGRAWRLWATQHPWGDTSSLVATHTHTHTHTYIYIHIYGKLELAASGVADSTAFGHSRSRPLCVSSGPASPSIRAT